MARTARSIPSQVTASLPFAFALLGALVSLVTAAPARAAFPGPPALVAFVSDRDAPGSAFEIYTMNADGTGQTRLTTSAPGTVNDMPSFSPNGTQIAFQTNRNGNYQIYSMNADGTGQTRLTNNAADEFEPTWSPDGLKIAFTTNRDGNFEIYSMNANGTTQTRLTNNIARDLEPAWSPDGTKIAFQSDRDKGASNFEIYSMNATDGSSQTRLTTNAATDANPEWSPDGTKIAFDSTRDTGAYQIYSMNANGTAQTRLTTDTATDALPAWSPDGGKIAFHTNRDGNNEIYSMDANGTAQTNFSNNPNYDAVPDWGRSPGYPRPKGATPIKVPLVPAQKQCTAPNRMHGAPLNFGSCKPPVQASSFLTVGTPDANGAAANAIGSVRLSVKGDATDVLIDVSMTDVRCKTPVGTTCGSANAAAGPDYTGSLDVQPVFRVTDRLNDGADPGTVSDFRPRDINPFIGAIGVPCSATADTLVGSTCQVATTANSLLPGAIQAGRRAIWQVGQIQVFDGGANGQPEAADATVFAVQGVFVP